jgi:hypothetical protein
MGSVIIGILARRLMNADQIREDLKHVRSIHFALVIVSGTLLYLIAAAWSEAPQLYAQLSSLEDFLANFRKAGVPLMEIDSPREAAAEREVLQIVQLATHTNLEYEFEGLSNVDDIGMPLPCMQMETGDARQPTSLIEYVDRATDNGCRFFMPEISDGEAQAMRNWIATNYLPYRTSERVFLGGFKVVGDTGKILLWRTYFRGRGGPTGPERPFPYEQEFDVGLRLERAALSKDWLQQRFPILLKYRQLIAASPEEALARVNGERTKAIGSLKEALFGVEVKAAHIGTVGPIIISAILFYLLAYLSHLATLVPEKAKASQDSVDFYSPWLGAMQNFLAFTGTALTVTVIPALTIFCGLWRLSALSIAWSGILAAVFGLLPGILISVIGFQLAPRRVESEQDQRFSNVSVGSTQPRT